MCLYQQLYSMDGTTISFDFTQSLNMKIGNERKLRKEQAILNMINETKPTKTKSFLSIDMLLNGSRLCFILL